MDGAIIQLQEKWIRERQYDLNPVTYRLYKNMKWVFCLLPTGTMEYMPHAAIRTVEQFWEGERKT